MKSDAFSASHASAVSSGLQPGDRVRALDRPDLGAGEVLRVVDAAGVFQADVAFAAPGGRTFLERIPIEDLERSADLWERLARGEADNLTDFRLKQYAIAFAHASAGGELSASRVNLLPHQVLLVHDLVQREPRRVLIADEVGLGKTIEVGMLLRELSVRKAARRILIVTPAGLTKNWQLELSESFRLYFEILSRDFTDYGSASWETHHLVIASIDALKQPRRMQRLLSAPRWDLVVFDEAHHLSRAKAGNKIQTTKNYRLAEALRGHTRDLLFLSATPHQGNAFHFWSLIQLLDDQLFHSPEALAENRGLLNRILIRRTKREVTDAEGRPIFRRRQVHIEPFTMAPREREFYDRLTDYLREGYSAAGLLGGKTSSEQRAIGFVMTTFQKIMASSPRAIAQALRRRLVVLLVREQLALEGRRSRKKADSSGFAEEIMARQDEALQVAEPMLGSRLEADVYVARVRRRLLARREEAVESTVWALEDDGSAEDVVFAESNIPGEIEKVRELIHMVPTGRDRRFAALLQAVSELLRQNLRERIVIFTQYRDTLDYVAEELASVYGSERVATLKGGPLEEKLEAVERFWSESGAQFLISTSAGGEGINLQVARILFNYDLPWNPMAVEQRIGRIHRYGQEDTVQVYTLIARDTVEERIYDILQAKLREVAKAIGKTDPKTGEVAEDFERDILGLLGGRPDYQELYRRAILDKNFKHTEEELARMVSEALKAREALAGLAQDLSTFNIESYRKLEGRYPLEEFGRWAREGVLRLGGAVLPDGAFWTLHTPEPLLTSSRCAPRYERVTFDRSLATRTRRCELGGIGHPLMDSLLETLQSPAFPGDVAGAGGSKVVAQYLVRSHPTKGTAVTRAFVIAFDLARGEAEAVPRLLETGGPAQIAESPIDLGNARGAIEVALEEAIQKWLPDPRERGGIETSLVGLFRA